MTTANSVTEEEAHWQASSDVVASPVSGELALLDMERDVYFTLNGTGAHVWSLLDTPRTVSEIATSLSRTFEMPEEDCFADAEALIESMNENGLVHSVDRPAHA